MSAGPIIRLERLRELWIHTGTACNLSCPFCHEGSKPGDERLQAPTLAELAPRLDEAAALGVDRFAFTGGEPLILKGILEILLHALQLKPVLVLTNGTAPFIRRAHQLATLRTALHALSFRVSIDSPEEALHDAGRGLKNFRKALEGLKLLHDAGFAVSIARQQQDAEDAPAIARKFQQLLRRHGLPADVPVVAIPQLGSLEAPRCLPDLAEGPWPTEPLCAQGRMLIRRAGSLRLTACPLVDDDPAFDAPPDLKQAGCSAVETVHRRCTLCRGVGVGYIDTVARPRYNAGDS